MKKIRFNLATAFFAVITLCISSLANAAVGDNFTVGNISYKVILISPNEVKVDRYTTTGGDVVIPNTVENGGVSYSVTIVGTNSFFSKGITSVIIPNSITTIETGAFISNQLTSVVIPDSVIEIGESSFKNNLLVDITLPSNITKLNPYVFSVNKLGSFIIPDGITELGRDALSYNPLTSITIPSSLKIIGAHAFRNAKITNITIPNTVTEIGGYAFAATELTSITLPSSITKIASGTFSNAKLTSITIPDTVTEIGENAFSDTELTSITLPSGIKKIAYGTFSNAKLTSITIPNTVIEIDRKAFLNNQLTSIVIPDSVTKIASGAFQNNYLNTVTVKGVNPPLFGYATADTVFGKYVDTFTPTDGDTEEGDTQYDDYTLDRIDLVIPAGTKGVYVTNDDAKWTGFKSVAESVTTDSITYVINAAGELEVTGYDIVGGTDVNIPSTITVDGVEYTVTRIGARAFQEKGITSITLPNSITAIGDSAFAGNGLTSITLPENIATIGANAFAGNNLTSITSKATVPPIIPSNAFPAHEDIDLVIPAGTKAAYVTDDGAKWTGFKSVAESVTTDSITYVINAAGEVEVTGYDIAGGTDVNIPSTITVGGVEYTVTRIGARVFQEQGLTSITLPNSITAIGDSAFAGNGLTSITLPENITAIGANAFAGNNLTSITSKATVPPVISSNTFPAHEGIDLVIPAGAEDAYVNNEGAQWTEFASVSNPDNPSENNAPVANDDSFELSENDTYTYSLDVLANDTDIEDDAAGTVLSLIGAKSTLGNVTIDDSMLRLDTDASVNGTVIVTYFVTDSEGTQSSATATITFNGQSSTAPTFASMQDIVIDATALRTKVALAAPTAMDNQGNALAVSLVDNEVFFMPGKHLVYWQATDSNGVTATAVQNLLVNPMVSISKKAQVSEGNTQYFSIYLNGKAPTYPVNIAYTVSGSADGSDHDLTSGELMIESGQEGRVEVTTFADSDNEGNETITITLDENLNLGANAATEITIVEGKITPSVTTTIMQDGEARSLIAIDGGPITIESSTRGINDGDEADITWSSTLPEGSFSDTDGQFTFNTEGLSPGIYTVSITVSVPSDIAGEPPITTTMDMYIEVVETLTPLTAADSDGDGIPDNIEGYGDTDGDGIPNYLDTNSACNIGQEQSADSTQFLVESEPGVCLRKDVSVAQNQTGGFLLFADELPSDAVIKNVGGLFGFVASGLPQAGDTLTIVLPQTAPILSNSVYRKYNGDTWVDFEITDNDKVFSAMGERGNCPAPKSSEWTEGFIDGAWCVQLQIVDGGPNDDDGKANRSIVDPGGVGVMQSDNTFPEANSDEVTINTGETITIDVVANDTDADGDSLTVINASVDFGRVMIENNQLVYISADNFTGKATIDYSITDSVNGSAASTVTVNVVTETPAPPTPSSENVKVNNQSSGGSIGTIALFILALVLLARRRTAVASYALLATSVMLSSAANANTTEQMSTQETDSAFSINATWGQARVHGNHITNTSEATQLSVDEITGTWSVGGFYQFQPNWQVGLRYIDLGEGELTIKGDTTNVEALHRKYARQAPVFGQGVGLEINYLKALTDNVEAKALVGLLRHDYEINSMVEGRTTLTQKVIDTRYYAGAAIAYTFTDNADVFLQYTHYELSADDVNEIAVGLSVSF